MRMTKLMLIKLAHTVIWVIMVACILTVLCAGIFNVVNAVTWTALFVALGECVVIVANKWVCPLTPLAGRYTTDREPNFDIYLPLWVARYNKQIFGPLFGVALLLFLWRVVL